MLDQYIEKEGKKLRLGYTTGSCAAAASKAAAWMLLSGSRKEMISIDTPKGIRLDLQVDNIEILPESVRCSIEKDSGDDPDITKGTSIFAEVSFSEEPGIYIDGGSGIGRVTKRGLDQPVGAAAINSVPRKMIRDNLEEVMKLMDYQGGLSVMISAPDGVRLARKTFNPRLGIEGGISILGTTGIVEPMSEQSLVDTIRVELKLRKEEGKDVVLLTPGNYGSDYIGEHIGIDPHKAVLTSNFIGDSLQLCVQTGFEGALLIGHIGKLVKLAGGMMNTHSKYGDCRMEIMASYSAAEGLPAERVREMLGCVTCDDALRILKEEGLCGQVLGRIVKKIADMMDHKVLSEIPTGAILFSKEYGFLCETDNAQLLLEKIRKKYTD